MKTSMLWILPFALLLGCGGGGGLFEETCSQCHDAGIVLNRPRTRVEWEVVVRRMSEHRKGTSRGEISAADQAAIVDRLVEKAGVR